MTGLIIAIVVLIIISAILRSLRRKYQIVDVIFALVAIIVSIVVWINSGFLWALGTFFVICVVGAIMLGMGDTTQIRRNGKTYSFECEECGYEETKVIEEDDMGVTIKCPRCNHTVYYKLE